MAKKKKSTAIQKAYRRERARIQRANRELKKYGFESSIKIPAIPKKITEASVNRLKKLTTRKIYESAEGARPETGDVINFREFRVVWRRSNTQVKESYKQALKSLAFKSEIQDLIKSERAAYDERIAGYSNGIWDDEPSTHKSPIQKAKQYDHIENDTVQGWQVAYSNFESMLEDYDEHAKAIIKSRLNVLESEYSSREVGEMIIEAYENGTIIDPSESYNIGLVFRMLNSFARMLQLNEEDSKAFIKAVDESEYFEGDWYE